MRWSEIIPYRLLSPPSLFHNNGAHPPLMIHIGCLPAMLSKWQHNQVFSVTLLIHHPTQWLKRTEPSPVHKPDQCCSVSEAMFECKHSETGPPLLMTRVSPDNTDCANCQLHLVGRREGKMLCISGCKVCSLQSRCRALPCGNSRCVPFLVWLQVCILMQCSLCFHRPRGFAIPASPLPVCYHKSRTDADAAIFC